MSRRLLVLKCSARKRGGPESIPAYERYDGPLWQVLRHAKSRQPLLLADLDVYALSAAFGLVSAGEAIPWYDQTMAPERADALRPEALARFGALLASGIFTELCLGLSQRYLRALDGWEQLVPDGIAVTLTDGSMGEKLGQLRAWLSGEVWTPAERPQRIEAAAVPRGSVELCGQTLAMPPEEVLARARQAVAEHSRAATRIRDWYVPVDGARVGTKWLVSAISGLPPSEFDASAARRVLHALGVAVERESG